MIDRSVPSQESRAASAFSGHARWSAMLIGVEKAGTAFVSLQPRTAVGAGADRAHGSASPDGAAPSGGSGGCALPGHRADLSNVSARCHACRQRRSSTKTWGDAAVSPSGRLVVSERANRTVRIGARLVRSAADEGPAEVAIERGRTRGDRQALSPRGPIGSLRRLVCHLRGSDYVDYPERFANCSAADEEAHRPRRHQPAA